MTKKWAEGSIGDEESKVAKIVRVTLRAEFLCYFRVEVNFDIPPTHAQPQFVVEPPSHGSRESRAFQGSATHNLPLYAVHYHST